MLETRERSSRSPVSAPGSGHCAAGPQFANLGRFCKGLCSSRLRSTSARLGSFGARLSGISRFGFDRKGWTPLGCPAEGGCQRGCPFGGIILTSRVGRGSPLGRICRFLAPVGLGFLEVRGLLIGEMVREYGLGNYFILLGFGFGFE